NLRPAVMLSRSRRRSGSTHRYRITTGRRICTPCSWRRISAQMRRSASFLSWAPLYRLDRSASISSFQPGRRPGMVSLYCMGSLLSHKVLHLDLTRKHTVLHPPVEHISPGCPHIPRPFHLASACTFFQHPVKGHNVELLVCRPPGELSPAVFSGHRATDTANSHASLVVQWVVRSEERRVGKEGRFGAVGEIVEHK